MRILLTSAASFVPPRGGSTRSNRVWLDELVARGHVCRVVCSAAPVSGQVQLAHLRRETANQGYLLNAFEPQFTATLNNGLVVSAHRQLPLHSSVLSKEIHQFAPDWVLVSSEDLGHSLLREADKAAPGRIVYLAHTPQFLPFGPQSWSPDAGATDRVQRAAAVVVIGNHMANYVQEHAGVSPMVIHPQIYGPGPWEDFGQLDAGFILMVNPCQVKGIGLFLATAHALPELRFAALPGWGTTAQDRQSLEALPNVKILEPVQRIEEVLAQTRILLVPSLWHEGFGLIAMEAMLRGIPVVASDSGGLVEAKQRSGYVLPVCPITEYLPEFDDAQMPRPVLPPQDAAPWINAVRKLTADRSAYEAEAESSREAALKFVYALKPNAMEELLVDLRPGATRIPVPDLAERVRRLSPAQRAALLKRSNMPRNAE